jgi:molybdopterin synthase catalytic subunit
VAFFRNDSEIDVENRVRDLVQKLGGRGIGAVMVFIGIVKDVVEGRKVHELFYEAHEEYALKVLDRIASEELDKDGVEAIEIMHRLGPAKQGEKTLYIAVAARGRKEALDAVKQGHVIKYVATLDAQKVVASVKIEKVPRDNVFAQINGTLNGVRIKSDATELFFIGRGGGRIETAHTVLDDVIEVALMGSA